MRLCRPWSQISSFSDGPDPPPDARKPGLLRARQPGRTIVVFDFRASHGGHERAPGFQVVVDPIAPAIPALLVVSPRVRGEEDPVRLERIAQLREDPREFPTGHVEQGRIGKDAVEMAVGKLQAEEILLPDLAAAVFT